MYCLLVLLFLSGQLFAQPVEGPWVITTTTNTIVSPEVCVRGSNADVLFIENDSVRYARFSLESQLVLDGPRPVFALRGWNTKSLHDLIRVNDSTWACLVSEDDWGGLGQNESYHRADLVFGGDASAFVQPLDSSVTHYYFPVPYEYWNDGYSLTPRVGGGAVAAWVSNVFIMFDLSIQYWVTALDENLNIDFRRPAGGGSLWNPKGNRVLARSVTADSLLAVSYGTNLCLVTRAEEWNSTCFASITCDYVTAEDFGLTFSGDRRILVCDLEGAGCLPYVLSIEFQDSDNVRCDFLGIVDVPAGLPASFWNPAYGFAVTHAQANSLQLARVDTNGIQTLPTGTLFWRDANHTFAEANVTILDAGQVVAIWTETQDGDTAARRVRMGTVGWDTPLASNPPDLDISPSSFSLNAYPNPFNSTLEIRYALPRAGKMEVAVFNVLGQRVATLEDGMRSSGMHNVTWTASGGSGIYFVTLQMDHEVRTEKVLLAR